MLSSGMKQWLLLVILILVSIFSLSISVSLFVIACRRFAFLNSFFFVELRFIVSRFSFFCHSIHVFWFFFFSFSVPVWTEWKKVWDKETESIIILYYLSLLSCFVVIKSPVSFCFSFTIFGFDAIIAFLFCFVLFPSYGIFFLFWDFFTQIFFFVDGVVFWMCGCCCCSF